MPFLFAKETRTLMNTACIQRLPGVTFDVLQGRYHAQLVSLSVARQGRNVRKKVGIISSPSLCARDESETSIERWLMGNSVELNNLNARN